MVPSLPVLRPNILYVFSQISETQLCYTFIMEDTHKHRLNYSMWKHSAVWWIFLTRSDLVQNGLKKYSLQNLRFSHRCCWGLPRCDAVFLHRWLPTFRRMPSWTHYPWRWRRRDKKLHPVSLENMKHLVVFISLDMNILLAFLFH